jgi:hypothetical protein
MKGFGLVLLNIGSVLAIVGTGITLCTIWFFFTLHIGSLDSVIGPVFGIGAENIAIVMAICASGIILTFVAGTLYTPPALGHSIVILARGVLTALVLIMGAFMVVPVLAIFGLLIISALFGDS